MDAKQKTLQLISEVSGIATDELKLESQLVADLGIDSARALHLLVKLEDELEIEVDDDEVADLQTVGHVLDFISRHQPATDG